MPTYHIEVRKPGDPSSDVLAEAVVDARSEAQAQNFLRDAMFEARVIGAAEAHRLGKRDVPLLTAASAGEEPQPALQLGG
ncbi:MAG: hypothetical protein RIS45_594 [Planctomycetota bacterium]|jgi:hypothetical protein